VVSVAFQNSVSTNPADVDKHLQKSMARLRPYLTVQLTNGGEQELLRQMAKEEVRAFCRSAFLQTPYRRL
jgi:hypothetical protein